MENKLSLSILRRDIVMYFLNKKNVMYFFDAVTHFARNLNQ